MSAYKLWTFKVDVTPPVGDYISGGYQPRSIGVETPLYLRGIVLCDEKTSWVMASIDYCYMIGRSQERFVDALARGAGIASSQVMLHSNHVHDAPMLDEQTHQLMQNFVPGIHNENYFLDVLTRARLAVESAMNDSGRKVSGVAFSAHKVDQFASTRRVIDDQNRCHIRWSVGNEPWIEAYPEGNIDRDLDLVGFFDSDGNAVAVVTSYACHPQVSNGRQIYSADSVGVALELFEKKHPDVFCIYFTGCAGDVTAGKYSTADLPRNRLVFGLRLYDAIESAFTKAHPTPLESISWCNRVSQVPLCEVDESTRHYQEIIRSSSTNSKEKYQAAKKLDRLERQVDTYPFRASVLRVNNIVLLFLPTELCVAYQQYAKSICNTSLWVAAYGDSYLNYVATDVAFDQGGYEVLPQWTEVSQGIEEIVKKVIRDILVEMAVDVAITNS